MHQKLATLIVFVMFLLGSPATAQTQTVYSTWNDLFAIDSNGHLWTWYVGPLSGPNANPYFQDNAARKPHLVPGEGGLVTFMDDAYVLRQDGTIWEGLYHARVRVKNPDDLPAPSKPLQPYREDRLSPSAPQRWKETSNLNNSSYLGVDRENKLWVWGYTTHSRQSYTDMPVPAPLKEAVSSPIMIGGGKYFKGTACAIKNSDGSIWCWGKNALGTDEESTDGITPVKVKVSGRFTKLASLGDPACGLRDDNTVWCWGDNSGGGLGLGKPEKSLTPDERQAIIDAMSQEERWQAEYGIGSDKLVVDKVTIPVQRPGRYSFITPKASLDMQGAVWVTDKKGMFKIPETKDFVEVSADSGTGNMVAKHKDGSIWQLMTEKHLFPERRSYFSSWEEVFSKHPDMRFTRVDFPK